MQLVTLIKTIDHLSRPQGATIQELSEHLSLSERQVFRIKKIMEADLCFPLTERNNGDDKKIHFGLLDTYVKKLPNIAIPSTDLTLSEIISLYLLKAEESIYRDTELDKTIQSAFGKLGLLLPEKSAEKLNKVTSLFISAPKYRKNYSGKEQLIKQLSRAMLEQKKCSVMYHSFKSNTEKKIQISPLHFFERDAGLYVFADSEAHQTIITLAVERIESLTITEEEYDYPEEFNPEKMLDSAFDIVFGDPIDFKIWFSADQARYIKQRIWSKTQKIEEQNDESIILSMTTSGIDDVKRWVLSYGAEAKVLEPKELLDAVTEELSKSLGHYQT